jgi:hypothetical protein
VGTKWGVCRNPIDLQNCQRMSGKKAASAANVEILLNWFSKVPGLHKFEYDVTDSQWIDVDAVISTVFLTYNCKTKVYSMEKDDAINLNEFVTPQSNRCAFCSGFLILNSLLRTSRLAHFLCLKK